MNRKPSSCSAVLEPGPRQQLVELEHISCGRCEGEFKYGDGWSSVFDGDMRLINLMRMRRYRLSTKGKF